MVEQIQALPGFRDFYPEDLASRSHIFAVWRDVARRYGFEEYDGPPLEPLELYTRKSGQEIVEQLYEFEDKGGRRVALRPEMTPTLARMVGVRAKALPKPVRWFSMPQLFRYERQQRGRLREHFQLNLDILGETDVLADAELLASGLDIMRSLGLGPEIVRARVSDRRLLAAIFREIGVAEHDLVAVYQIVDRREREPNERVEERLSKLGLDARAIEAIFETLEMGPPELTGRFGDAGAVVERLEELETYLRHVGDLGFAEYVDVDLSIVRGLAYYTGIVFELWDARRQLRAICGGGRYDDLLSGLMGVEMPALGFGMGDVVLRELLEESGRLPDYDRSIDIFLVAIGEDARRRSLQIASELRSAGASIVYDFRERSVARQFKSADQANARRAIVMGPRELESGEAVLRDMRSGDQRAIPLEGLVAEVMKEMKDPDGG